MEFKPQKTYSYNISAERGRHIIPEGMLFSKVNPYHKAEEGSDDDGVKQYLTLEGLIENIKNTPSDAQKSDHAYLKGIYKGGIRGTDCQTTVDYMFFDIDHKKTVQGQSKSINTWLDNGDKKDRVLSVLEKYTVFTGFSSSKKGMFGALHVIGLSQFKAEDKAKHKLCCMNVCDYLAEVIYEEVEIEVEFDPAQSNFRQIRYGAPQLDDFGINNDFYSFSFEETTSEVYIPNTEDVALTIYDGDDEGSAYAKFDKAHACDEFLTELGFYHVGDDRYKWQPSNSKSASSGQVMPNGVFICNSTTFLSSIDCEALSHKQAFRPYQLYMLVKGFNTYSELLSDLQSKGYEHTIVKPSDYYDRVKRAKSNQEIAHICYYFRYQDLQTRKEFFDNAPIPKGLRNYYRFYLGIKDLKIHHDKEYKIEWVSDKVELLYNTLDEKKKVALTAPTGSGKTRGVVENLPKFRPEWRTLFIVPITIIGEQLASLLDKLGILDYVLLKGDSNEIDGKTRKEARKKPFVISTYNKAAALLENNKNNIFDLIVIDELHSYILNNSYRLPVLKELDYALVKYFEENEETRLLGLSGTPLKVFENLGYYRLKFNKELPPTKCIARKDNRSVDVIINNHEQTLGADEKVLYITHGAKILPELRKDQIIKGRTTEATSIVFTAETKEEGDFRKLVETSKIRPEVNRIYSSPVIVEGTNIDNRDISTVVIYSRVDWRPEMVTQGLARTRNKDINKVIPVYVGGRNNDVINPYVDGFDRAISEIQGLVDLRSDDFSSINSMASLNSYKHKGKKLYKNIIAFEETQNWSDNLTLEEKFEVMRINFNIDITLDKDYEQDNTIKSVGKVSQSDKRKTKSYFFKNCLDEVLTTCVQTAKGQVEKRIVKDFVPYPVQVSDATRAFVRKYKKEVYDVLKEYSTFVKYHDDPESLLFNKKGNLEGLEKLKAKSRFVKLQYTIQMDADLLKSTREERIEKGQLEQLLNQLDSSINYVDLSKLMRQCGLRPPRSGYLKEGLKAFVTTNTPLVWDASNSKFVGKKTNKAAVTKYIKDWMRPIQSFWVEDDEPEPEIEKQLQLKL